MADQTVRLDNESFEILLQGENRGERPTIVTVEDDGTLRIWALQVSTDADGEERVSLVDTNRVPWTHVYENYQVVNPVLLTGAEAVLLGPLGVATAIFAVEYEAVNIDLVTAQVFFTIGVDVGASGALTVDEYWALAQPIPNRGATGWRGPYIIAGTDTIRGLAVAANDITVHFRVKRVDIGA